MTKRMEKETIRNLHTIKFYEIINNTLMKQNKKEKLLKKNDNIKKLYNDGYITFNEAIKLVSSY